MKFIIDANGMLISRLHIEGYEPEDAIVIETDTAPPEEFSGVVYWRNGWVVEPFDVIEQTKRELLKEIKLKRNQRLVSCDWTQTLDAPLTQEKKVEWATYRQALRDFPDTCDIENPVWPVAPQ